MAKPQDIDDERVVRALDLYARMVGRVLADPQRWLGLDDEPPPSAPFPAKVLDALRDRALGDTTPASPAWAEQPLQRRVDWWVTRIGISAGLAVYPYEAHDMPTLIAEADKALMQGSKRHGKNRLSLVGNGGNAAIIPAP